MLSVHKHTHSVQTHRANVTKDTFFWSATRFHFHFIWCSPPARINTINMYCTPRTLYIIIIQFVVSRCSFICTIFIFFALSLHFIITIISLGIVRWWKNPMCCLTIFSTNLFRRVSIGRSHTHTISRTTKYEQVRRERKRMNKFSMLRF